MIERNPKISNKNLTNKNNVLMILCLKFLRSKKMHIAK